jgi:hypothetical protein
MKQQHIMQAVAHVVYARAHTSDNAFEEAVVPTTPNGFVVVWWRAVVFVCAELAAAEGPNKR